MRQRGKHGAEEAAPALDLAWSKPVISVRLSEARKAKLARVAESLPASASPADAIDAAIDRALAEPRGLDDELGHAPDEAEPARAILRHEPLGSWLLRGARAASGAPRSAIARVRWMWTRRQDGGQAMVAVRAEIVAWDGRPRPSAQPAPADVDIGPFELGDPILRAIARRPGSPMHIVASLDGSEPEALLFASDGAGGVEFLGRAPV